MKLGDKVNYKILNKYKHLFCLNDKVKDFVWKKVKIFRIKIKTMLDFF